MISDDPRHSAAYVAARKVYMRSARERDDPCWLCGHPINWSVSGRQPAGPSVDHALPVATHPEHALDVELWRTAHLVCNVRRGSKLGHQRKNGTTGTERASTADRW